MTAPRFLLVLGVLCLLGLGSAQSPLDAPQCGTTCALRFLSLPDYANKTQQQLCHDKGFARLMSRCVKEACTVRESLTFANISSTACGRPALDRRTELQLTSLIMTGLAGVFFVVRLASKIHGLASWGADDSLIVASFILLIPTIIMIQLAIPQGVGLDIWVLTDDQITAYLKSLFIFQIFYALTLTLIKASILFFFLRIFPDHKFRIAVWLTLACDLLLGVATFILTLIQRDPLRLVWEGWKDKVPQGVVFDVVKMAMGHGIIHIALDVWMLILPLTQLYSIGLKLRKKIGVIAMFSIGVFLTFVSIVKFVVFLQFLKSPDSASVSVANTVLWCCIELCVGIMVACMPHVRQLIRDVLFGRRARNTNDVIDSDDEPIFTDRSLRTIVDDGTSPGDTLVLHDRGELLSSVTVGSKNESVSRGTQV